MVFDIFDDWFNTPEFEGCSFINVLIHAERDSAVGRAAIRIVRSIRQLELKKAPSVSETLDWARTLVLLGIEHIDAQQAKETLHILLKYQTDIAKAAKELSVDAPTR